MSSSTLFLSKVALMIYCGTPWRRFPFPFPFPSGPFPSGPVPPGPDPPPFKPPPLPWIEQLLGNLHFGVLGAVVVATAVTHQREAFSLEYGGFLLVPALQVVGGLWYNNFGAVEKAKVKQ